MVYKRPAATRTRQMLQSGSLCGATRDVQTCNELPCASAECTLGEWSLFTPCLAACGAGERQRFRRNEPSGCALERMREPCEVAQACADAAARNKELERQLDEAVRIDVLRAACVNESFDAAKLQCTAGSKQRVSFVSPTLGFERKGQRLVRVRLADQWLNVSSSVDGETMQMNGAGVTSDYGLRFVFEQRVQMQRLMLATTPTSSLSLHCWKQLLDRRRQANSADLMIDIDAKDTDLSVSTANHFIQFELIGSNVIVELFDVQSDVQNDIDSNDLMSQAMTTLMTETGQETRQETPWAFVGIGIGLTLLCFAIVILFFAMRKRKQSSKQSNDNETELCQNVTPVSTYQNVPPSELSVGQYDTTAAVDVQVGAYGPVVGTYQTAPSVQSNDENYDALQLKPQ